MADDDKISIKVNVVDRLYPLRIERADEEKIRKAAALISEKVMHYKQRYADKDMQDCLAMASLQFVTKLIEADGRQSNAEMVDSLADLDEWLGAYLERQNISSFK